MVKDKIINEKINRHLELLLQPQQNIAVFIREKMDL